MGTIRRTSAWAFVTAGIFVLAGLLLASCDSFLQRPPQGRLSQDALDTEQGVQAVLVGAYAVLDGYGTPGADWAKAASNWLYGSMAGGVAHKGSSAGDGAIMNPIADWSVSPANPLLNAFWIARYEGVNRTNEVLSLLERIEDMSEEEKKAIAAEARFLRGHYYFELKKMFGHVPWIDEDTENFKQPNTGDSLWIHIEADFRFAMNNLPETQAGVARANKWAAAAYLAKAYLYQEKWKKAASLFDKVINQGVTSSGDPYALVDQFERNFRASTEHNSEAVFAVEFGAHDGTDWIGNSRAGDALNVPFGGPFTCCGFHQPTQDLVNSYRTDPKTGLPLIVANNGINSINVSEPLEYNADPIESDQGVSSKDLFTPTRGTPDPRLDWTVGRRGVPYHDWGPHAGKAWIRDQSYAGPYSPKKNVWWQVGADQFHGLTAGASAINYVIIRFADVLLMAAEAHAHLGHLEQARRYVNRVRARVADPNPADGETPEGWVSNDLNKAFAAAVVETEAQAKATDVEIGDWVVCTGCNSTFVLIDVKEDGTEVWNEYKVPDYQIGLYPGPWTSKEKALQRIYFERKLELAMEGHRYFDLARWGIAPEVLNQFYAYEGSLFPDVADGHKREGTEYFPIPQRQIDLSTVNGEPTLKQNPGY